MIPCCIMPKNMAEYNRHGLLAYSRTDLLKLIMDVYRVKEQQRRPCQISAEYIVLNDAQQSGKLKEVKPAFDENLRQQNWKNQRIQQEQERKTICWRRVAVFIPLFFGIIILLRKGRDWRLLWFPIWVFWGYCFCMNLYLCYCTQ